jgi:hypothetical protein
MTKGRNTSVVSIRLPDGVISTLKAEAFKQCLSLSEYLKQIILSPGAINLDSSEPQVKSMRGITSRLSPNKPCPCGAKYSDGNFKKYKHCCGKSSDVLVGSDSGSYC